MDIIITKEGLNLLRESYYVFENTTKTDFNQEVKSFISNLLSGESQNKKFWKLLGYNNTDVVNLLKKFNLVVYDDSFDGFKAPKKNFDRNINRLYYHIFNDKDDEQISEDGEGGTSCSSVGGSYETPLFSTQRRKINV